MRWRGPSFALAALLPAFFLCGAGFAAGLPVAWPPGLFDAAAAHRASLAATQESVRTSSLQTSFGVEETVQFDLVTHACHRGPGQAWRDYGEPRLLSAAGEEARVRYPFQLHFRQALTLEEMFQKPWREGSDGEIEVSFQKREGRWVPAGKKEVLQRREGTPPREGEGGRGRKVPKVP